MSLPVAISEAVQDLSDTSKQLAAFGALKDWLAKHPQDQEARDLYDKYSRVGRDWTLEVKSGHVR